MYLHVLAGVGVRERAIPKGASAIVSYISALFTTTLSIPIWNALKTPQEKPYSFEIPTAIELGEVS